MKKKNTTKLTIDERLSALFDLPRKDVSALTDEFLAEVMRLLVNGHTVYLQGFGEFHVSVRRGRRANHLVKRNCNTKKVGGPMIVDVRAKYYVSFKRAQAFKVKFDERFGKQKVVKDGK